MKKHLKKIIIIATVLLLVAALLIVYFAFFYKSPEERAAIAAQNAALAAHRALMTAHTASNTELLESDKFFDKPDFMIYEIGGKKIECTPEEADAIYAEFEKMVANIYAMTEAWLCEYKLDRMVPAYKNNGAIRFCYDQRHKYIGEYPHETPVYYPMTEVDEIMGQGPYAMTLAEYEWEDFTFDEVLIYPDSVCGIVLGENGAYKFVRDACKYGKTETVDYCGIDLYINREGYSAKDFDLAVRSILRINERFPDLVVNERNPFCGE